MLQRTLCLTIAALAGLCQTTTCQDWSAPSIVVLLGFNVDGMANDAVGLIGFNGAAQKTWLQGTGGWASFSTTPVSRQWSTCGATLGEVYMFGGSTSAGYENDLWRFDRSSNDWQLLTPGGIGAPGPSQRIYSVAAPTANGLLFFGGKDGAQ